MIFECLSFMNVAPKFFSSGLNNSPLLWVFFSPSDWTSVKEDVFFFYLHWAKWCILNSTLNEWRQDSEGSQERREHIWRVSSYRSVSSSVDGGFVPIAVVAHTVSGCEEKKKWMYVNVLPVKGLKLRQLALSQKKQVCVWCPSNVNMIWAGNMLKFFA